MKKCLVIVALLEMFFQNVSAASFDCNKASTNIEKAICQNSELNSLDEKLASLYKSIKSKYPTYIAENLTFHQKAWLKKRNTDCKDANIDCLGVAYKYWIGILEDTATADTSGLDFSSDDKVIKIVKGLAIFTDPKGNSYISWLLYPNTKVSLLKQLMSYPFSIGFAPYNTHEHPISFKQGEALKKVDSCMKYIEAKKAGFELSYEEPYRLTINYLLACEEIYEIIGGN